MTRFGPVLPMMLLAMACPSRAVALTPDEALELARNGEASVAAISEALAKKSNDSPVMAWALAEQPVAAARPALEATLQSTDQRTGYWAALALGAIGDPASAAALATVLPADDTQNARPYWELAYWTADGWISMHDRTYTNGNPVIPPAPEGVPNIRVAFACLVALGQVGGPEAAPHLLGKLASPQWLIRLGAVRGLGHLGNPDHRAQIAQVAQSDPVLAVRVEAEQALARLGGAAKAAEPPPLDVPSIIFLKTAARTESSLGFQDSYFYPKMPWYQWGENIYRLTPPRPDGELRNLTGFTNSRVQGVELSYDATRVVFSRCDDEAGTGFHICEMNVDGSGLRQLTEGNCNDVDPYYLPDGRILFVSDRSGHHEYYHQERSRSLYVMDADGSDVRRLTFNPNQDYAPVVLSDGRVAYTSYRFYGQDGSGDIYQRGSDLNRIETQLRVTNPDGSLDSLLYGAMRGSFYTPIGPMVDGLADSGASNVRGEKEHIGVSVSWVRDFGDGRLVCITPAGLTLLDLSVGPLDCEIPFFPEILNIAGGEEVYIHSHDELNPVGRYTSPYPADDGRLFVAYAPWWDTSFSAYGLYLFDMETRERTLVYDDPAVSDVDPIPVVPREPPLRILPDFPRPGTTGTILCASVFNSDKTFAREAVRYVRVLGATLMGEHITNANASFESHVLGTVPIQRDGSFNVEVPADRPVRFQLLDADENVLLHETAFNYVRGGEKLTCVGCHEPKGQAPPQAAPLAATLPPYPALERFGNLIYHGRVQRSYNQIARP